MNTISRLAGTTALALLAACDGGPFGGGGNEFAEPPAGLAACTTAPILTTSPAALTNIDYVVPLGNLNPGGHTFPSDHIYFITPRVANVAQSVSVVSPGDVRLTGVATSTNNQGGTTVTDYSLYFYGCADVQFYFHHILSLTQSMLTAIGPLTGSNCQTYNTGGSSYTRCNKSVDVTLHAGDAIGTAGGAGNAGFDLGAYDRRTPRLAFVNQNFPDFGSNSSWNTFHTVCPLDYFSASAKSALEAKLGNHTGARTVAPICGTIMQDVPNTAQGRWFNGSAQQEDSHLALVHDNVTPGVGAFSMGNSVPSIPLGVYNFTPAASATTRVNTDFNAVTANGQPYCYESFIGGVGGNKHVLLQLVSATSLKIEGLAGATCGSSSTWAFTSAAVTFAR